MKRKFEVRPWTGASLRGLLLGMALGANAVVLLLRLGVSIDTAFLSTMAASILLALWGGSRG